MALGFDPFSLPVVGVDDHLPVLPATVMEADALRARFGAPPAWAPETQAERRINGRSPAHASVLIALAARSELMVLLTERTDHLTDHPGQISFPGGRAEPEDADATATALREANEEIGLSASYVDVLGTMPTYTTGTGFIVTPVVALVRPGFSLLADPYEVAEVFETPLAYLMDPSHHHRHAIEIDGLRREFISIPWHGVDPAGRSRRYFIWGATAAMLRNLYRFLAA